MRKLIIVFILLTAASWVSAQIQNSDKKPFVLGEIRELQSGVLGEKRILNIYLPEGYDADRAAKYPVIYLLDGSADEDFIHVVGLVQFDSFEWIKRVPKSIVIGIATVDRRRDFTFSTTVAEDKKKYPTTGNSDKFITFLEKELQPFVEKNYQVSDSKTLIGQSLGGLLATEILFKNPALFDKYIIVSPSLWWDNGSILDLKPKVAEDHFTRRTDVYIGVGKEGLTPTKPARVMEVDANLLAEKLNSAKRKNLNIYLDYLPQEDHATVAHQAISNAFQFLYPKIAQ